MRADPFGREVGSWIPAVVTPGPLGSAPARRPASARGAVVVHLQIRPDPDFAPTPGSTERASLVLPPNPARLPSGILATAFVLLNPRTGRAHWRRSSTPPPPAPACALPRQQPSRRARRTTGSPRLSGSHAARGRRYPPRYCFPDGIGRTPQAKSDRPASADRAIASRGNHRPEQSASAVLWRDCFDDRGLPGLAMPAVVKARYSFGAEQS